MPTYNDETVELAVLGQNTDMMLRKWAASAFFLCQWIVGRSWSWSYESQLVSGFLDPRSKSQKGKGCEIG